MVQLSDPPRDGRREERDRWSGLLARPTVSSPDFQEHSQRDLARRRLLLDQARHRWLLASRRAGQEAAARPAGVMEPGTGRDLRNGPLAVRETNYAWGLRRVGGHQEPDPRDHPLGAASICRFHTWRWHLQRHEMRCTICGLTSQAEF